VGTNGCYFVLLLQKHPEVHIRHKTEALQKHKPVVDVLRHAAEDKGPIYGQTGENIGDGKD
jgi:hypothetical protein